MLFWFLVKALIFMGIVAAGPIMMTWAGTHQCPGDNNKDQCDKQKLGVGISGAIATVVVYIAINIGKVRELFF
jgi:hypothetical protein